MEILILEWGDRMQGIQGMLGRYTGCTVGMRQVQGVGGDLYKGCKVYKLSFFGGGRYNGCKVGTRQVQGVRGRYKECEVGMRQVQGLVPTLHLLYLPCTSIAPLVPASYLPHTPCTCLVPNLMSQQISCHERSPQAGWYNRRCYVVTSFCNIWWHHFELI